MSEPVSMDQTKVFMGVAHEVGVAEIHFEDETMPVVALDLETVLMADMSEYTASPEAFGTLQQDIMLAPQQARDLIEHMGKALSYIDALAVTP